MTRLAEVRDLLHADQIPLVDDMLCDYFSDCSGQIEQELVERFPRREAPILAAFRAHRAGEFFLSVPVLLAQADGICAELTDVSLYAKSRGDSSPKTRAFVESIDADSFIKALLVPLAEELPISASASQRGPDWDKLNRHQVQHGESVDYGTRTNSLKSISLIYFIALVQDLVQDASS